MGLPVPDMVGCIQGGAVEWEPGEKATGWEDCGTHPQQHRPGIHMSGTGCPGRCNPRTNWHRKESTVLAFHKQSPRPTGSRIADSQAGKKAGVVDTPNYRLLGS
jgi:hypothetical protein